MANLRGQFAVMLVVSVADTETVRRGLSPTSGEGPEPVAPEPARPPAVLLYPDPRLKQVCAPAQPEEAERVAARLQETMAAIGHCVGIAAPQLGASVRVAVADVSSHPKAETSNGELVLINPKVVGESGAEVGREGCLSIPELTANVRRAAAIRVEHAGGVIESEGFEARCILHEIDHLDGILFLDRVTSIVDDVFRRRSSR